MIFKKIILNNFVLVDLYISEEALTLSHSQH